MLRLFRRAGFILTGFFCATGLVCAPASATSGYQLDQLTSLNGKYRVYVCPDMVRVDQLSYGYSYVSHAPNWDVQVFRDDKKEYAQVSYKDWMKTNLLLVSTLWTMELKKPSSSRHFEQGGQSYITYLFPSTSATGGYFRGDKGSDFKDLENNRGEVMCLDFPADQHAGSIVGRAIGLPELKGTPVQITRKSATVNSWTLKTVKTKRDDKLAATLFNVPAGYKKIAFSRSMFSSSSQKEDIDDLFGMSAGDIKGRN